MKAAYFILLSFLSLITASCDQTDPMPPREGFSISRIYSINVDGSGLRLISIGNSFILLPNNKLFYLKNSKLYSCNVDGSDSVIISPVNLGVSQYQLISGGKKILFFQYEYPNVISFTMNLDGSGLNQLSKFVNLKANYGVAFSPDAKKIAFTTNAGFYIMNIDGTDQKLIRDTSNRSYCYDMSFAPDGNDLFYIHDIQYGVALDLRLYNIASGQDTSLFYNNDGNKIIAYEVSNWNTLLFSNGDGVNLENLNNYTFKFLHNGGEPQFSYDSTKITYVDFSSNTIYVEDIRQNDIKAITVNLPKNFISHPVLSLDEKKVFFQADSSWEVIVKRNSNDNIVY